MPAGNVYRVTINEIDNSAFRAARGSVIAIVGPAMKGPHQTSKLCRSETELEKFFGTEISGFYGIACARQAIRAGAKVRFARTVHQSDAADFATQTSVRATVNIVDQAGTPLNTIRARAKEYGTWANGVTVTVAAATSADATKFKLSVSSPGFGIPAEVHDELTLADLAGIVSDHWDFADLASATVAPNNLPEPGVYTLASGANGTTSITDTEELGNSQTNTGIYSLNGEDDFLDCFAPDVTTSAPHVLFKTWAETTFKLAHLTAPSTVTAANIEAFRRKTGSFSADTVIDSSYVSLHFGQLEFLDMLSSISGTAFFPNAGALAGVLGKNDTVPFDEGLGAPGPWKTPSGLKRGKTSALSCLVNISADQTLLNTLNDIGVNWFQPSSGFNIAKGNRTLTFANTLTRYLNIRRMILQLRMDLKPIFEAAFDEPNDPFLWRSLYRDVSKVLSELKSNRGIVDFFVDFDQDKKNSAEATHNTPDVVAAGMFKGIIRIQPLPTIQFIDISLIIDSLGVTYTELAA